MIDDWGPRGDKKRVGEDGSEAFRTPQRSLFGLPFWASRAGNIHQYIN